MTVGISLAQVCRWNKWLLTLLRGCCLLLLLGVVETRAVAHEQAVVWIVLDGVRWQELTRGLDTQLIADPVASGSRLTAPQLRRQYGDTAAQTSRERLMPFVWHELVPRGQLYGNRDRGSNATVLNPYWFSYPGYNEMLTGEADVAIGANDYGANPNQTLMAWLATQPQYRDSIGIYATWDVFHDIFNDTHTQLAVVAGQNVVSDAAHSRPRHAVDASFCVSDASVFARLQRDLKAPLPKLLFVGFGEADTWAHMRRYDQVLKTLQQADGYIQALWELYQRDPKTRNHTTFLLTTDHGRGRLPATWSEHWSGIDGANEIFMLWRGPGIAPLGEAVGSQPVWQAQIAATVAAQLGYAWRDVHPQAAAQLSFISTPTDTSQATLMPVRSNPVGSP